jgi:hypothetical protein
MGWRTDKFGYLPITWSSNNMFVEVPQQLIRHCKQEIAEVLLNLEDQLRACGHWPLSLF